MFPISPGRDKTHFIFFHVNLYSFQGNPLPKVTWWTGGVLYDSSDEVTRSGVIVNRMVYKDLQRQDLGKKFQCQAFNTNLTMPVSREVKVVLNRKSSFLLLFFAGTKKNSCEFTLEKLDQLH